MSGTYTRQGRSCAQNISGPTQVSVVTKDQDPGTARLVRVNVIAAGTSAGAAYDTSSAAGASSATQVAAWPNTIGSYVFDCPILAGIYIVPGTGQGVVVIYD